MKEPDRQEMILSLNKVAESFIEYVAASEKVPPGKVIKTALRILQVAYLNKAGGGKLLLEKPNGAVVELIIDYV